jgi:hypothetical protein
MPCKGGYRESIDEGKRHLGEQRERMLTDPYRKLWVSLVELVHLSPSGFDGLSDPQKLYFAVSLLEEDVYNGGFHQYFFNNAGSYYAYAEEGLIALCAFQTLELLQEAKDVLFPSIPVRISIAERRRTLPSYSEDNSPTSKWSEKLDDLENRYSADSGGHHSPVGSLRTESWTCVDCGVTVENSYRSEPGVVSAGVVSLMASCGPTLAASILRP